MQQSRPQRSSESWQTEVKNVARTLPDDSDLWTAQDKLYAHQATQRGVRLWPADWPPLTNEQLAELTEEAELHDDEEA